MKDLRTQSADAECILTNKLRLFASSCLHMEVLKGDIMTSNGRAALDVHNLLKI
jgi:hypothetical protein